MTSISATLALGAGCYWGTEKFIVKDFQDAFPGSIKDAKAGFMNPDQNGAKDPDYMVLSTGMLGHVEVVNLELNNATPELVEELLKFFFSFHDPTQLNRQEGDVGPQYASHIFCKDAEQTRIANKVKEELQLAVDQNKVSTYKTSKVTTRVVGYTDFYLAKEEHQEYLMKNPSGVCSHRFRFREWPQV